MNKALIQALKRFGIKFNYLYTKRYDNYIEIIIGGIIRNRKNKTN